MAFRGRSLRALLLVPSSLVLRLYYLKLLFLHIDLFIHYFEQCYLFRNNLRLLGMTLRELLLNNHAVHTGQSIELWALNLHAFLLDEFWLLQACLGELNKLNLLWVPARLHDIGEARRPFILTIIFILYYLNGFVVFDGLEAFQLIGNGRSTTHLINQASLKMLCISL